MSDADKNPGAARAGKGSGKIKWIVGGILLMFAVAAAMNLPRGYNDDLSRIGKGQPTLVLVRDKNAVQSFDLMNVLNGIRDQYAGKVEFLLTDFDTSEGKAFIAANHAARATIVLLDASGKLVKILSAPQTAENMQQEIAAAFGVKP